MIKFIRNIFFFIVMIFFLFQKGQAQRFNFSFEQFTTDDGLSHENIISITKDKDGFLWLGTANGLNRFDGLNFKIFLNKAGDNQTIPANYVAGTTLDKNGYLWIATNNGLCRMDTRTLKIDQVLLKAEGDNFPRAEVMYGEFDSEGTGWYIVNNYLYAVNQQTLKWKRYPMPVTRFHGNSSQVDSRDRIWLSIGRAKYLFDPKTEQFRYLMGFDWAHRNTDILCGSVREDSTGRLWMGTWAHGFFIWNENKQDFDKYATAPESMTSFEFDKDEQGRPFMWCGGGAYGLMAYDTIEKKFFQFKNDPRDKYTHNLGQTGPIFRDTSSGIVWIGTENGLEKYDPYAIRFHRYRIWQQKDELTNSQYFFTSGFVKDKTDTTGNTWWVSVWIGGLYKWNRSQLTLDENYVQTPGIKEAGIFAMLQAKDGMIWIGHGLGVQVMDPRKNKFIRHYNDFFPDEKEKRHTVTFISEDSKSNMWFSTYQGLFSWQRKGDSIVNWGARIPELKGIYPLNIREDDEGYIWFSSGNGVGKLDPAKSELTIFTNAKRKNKKLPEDEIGALYIDRAQNIWVSGPNYLAKLDKQGEVLKIYDNESGYAATGVFAMAEDPQGFLWISTDNKLHRLNTATGHFDYFDKSDGLFNNKIADGFYMSDKGELFLGFNGAINSINTNNIAFNKKPPVIFVSRLNIKGQQRQFDADNKVIIKPGERNIIIEFSALNYSQSQKNRFAFLLEGYDSTWRYTGDRTISLMNLEGGNHRLHVKASNNDGVWSRESVYTIKVIPPFHQTIWFKLLLVAVAGLLFLLSFIYRKQQRKRLEKIRERIATDLHDDMGSTLSSIRIFSDVAKKQIEKPETVQLLDKISNNATSLSENMQDIIWTIRSDNDTLEDLVSRMREFGLRVCDAKNIRFNTTVSQSFKASKLTLEQRRNLYLIFKEALNNAVKYSQCTQIDLILNLKNRFLKLELADNGKGFNAEEIQRGNGLNNLEKRAKEINGQIDIKSAPGKGTCINLMVILKKSLLTEK